MTSEMQVFQELETRLTAFIDAFQEKMRELEAKANRSYLVKTLIKSGFPHGNKELPT